MTSHFQKPESERLAQMQRIRWHLTNPDVGREEWALLWILKGTRGIGRTSGDTGAVICVETDFDAMAAFAEMFLQPDATAIAARNAWSGTLRRLYRVGMLERHRLSNQDARVCGQSNWSFRYHISNDADYAHWWRHPDHIRQHVVRAFAPF